MARLTLGCESEERARNPHQQTDAANIGTVERVRNHNCVKDKNHFHNQLQEATTRNYDKNKMHDDKVPVTCSLLECEIDDELASKLGDSFNSDQTDSNSLREKTYSVRRTIRFFERDNDKGCGGRNYSAADAQSSFSSRNSCRRNRNGDGDGDGDDHYSSATRNTLVNDSKCALKLRPPSVTVATSAAVAVASDTSLLLLSSSSSSSNEKTNESSRNCARNEMRRKSAISTKASAISPIAAKSNAADSETAYSSCSLRTLRKLRTLSLVQDFRLESVLNEHNVDRPSRLSSPDKNNSFLHGGALKMVPSSQQRSSVLASFAGANCQRQTPTNICDCDNQFETAYYEEPDIVTVAGGDGHGHGHGHGHDYDYDVYSNVVDDIYGNVYDSILYSSLLSSDQQNRNDSDTTNYETVSPPVQASSSGSATSVKNNLDAELSSAYSAPCGASGSLDSRPGAAPASDSDSSFENTNSLYETRSRSDSESISTDDVVVAAAADCYSINDYDDRRSEWPHGPHRYSINDRRSISSGVSDDWIDVNSCDDSDDNNYAKKNTKKRPTRLSRLRKFKKKKIRSLQIQKNHSSSDSTYFQKNDVDFPEEICDDFDDSSSEECEFFSHPRDHPSSSKDEGGPLSSSIHIHPAQNIYGLVEKARRTVRKSWSSLNQMRKNGVSSIVTNFPSSKVQESSRSTRNMQSAMMEINTTNGNSIKKGGSVRWASFKTKLRPKYSTVGANSTSVFYLNPEDLRFENINESNFNGDKKLDDRRRRTTTCLDFNLTRPSSPPPPPPQHKLKYLEKTIQGAARPTSSSCSSVLNDETVSLNNTRSPLSNSVNSELDLSSCSDLPSRFADEPLYQFYAEFIVQLSTYSALAMDQNDSDGYEEIGSVTSRPSALELITPSPNGHGQCRSLWCEVDEVKNSRVLETLNLSLQKLQEAKFEVITSEASYYKSLSVLDKIFVCDLQLRDENFLCKNDWKTLFGNVSAVRKCSEMLLSSLEKCWQQNIMLIGLGEIIQKHAADNFKAYIKYCSNQIYIDRTLKRLKDRNPAFVELISKLEADPICQSLSLHSFLMLPMQRITRMPLLVDAILSKLDPVTNQADHKTFKITLATLNKIVKDCNENARKFERYEEMLLLSRQLEFSRKDVKMFSVASSSRWLIRSGPMTCVNPQEAKLTITRKLTKQTNKLYFFLFNDMLVIAKKKSEDIYVVIDYCIRNVMQMSAIEDGKSFLTHSSSVVAASVVATSNSTTIPIAATAVSDTCSAATIASNTTSSTPAILFSPHRYLLLLTVLENHEGKTIEMILSCDSDSTRQRWLEAASSSRPTSDNPDEKLYEGWDCPQVLAVHAYTAQQPDEFSLQIGDVVKVLRKTTDGWYHGERIRDGMIGWFPGNHTSEIASQHTRAKNLKLRHRLLTLSANYLQQEQFKIS